MGNEKKQDERRFEVLFGRAVQAECGFAEFCADNQEEPDACATVGSLAVGSEAVFGGGEWATTTVRRVA